MIIAYKPKICSYENTKIWYHNSRFKAYILHATSYILHHTRSTIHPTCYNCPTFYILHAIIYIHMLHPTSYMLYHISCILQGSAECNAPSQISISLCVWLLCSTSYLYNLQQHLTIFVSVFLWIIPPSWLPVGDSRS